MVYDERYTFRFGFRLTPLRWAMLAFMVLFLAVTGYRFAFGLGDSGGFMGSVTNLNDHWTWGLWKYLVFPAVALAGCGYGTVFLAHVLHIKRFYPVARVAMVVSLLGYSLAMVVLLFDITVYYNFWRPFVYWGYTSILFEVLWCMTLYWMIQILEFGHIAFERIDAPRIYNLLDRAMPVLICVGIMLPSLHQASLGGLFIATTQLYPAWWSTWIPWFFMISSLMVGPAVVTFSCWALCQIYGKRFEDLMPSLTKLCLVGAGLMGVYVVLKVWDLTARGAWGYVFNGTLQGNMFLLEHVVFLLVPLVIFLTPSIRNSVGGLVTASILTGVGVILNRTNVMFTGMAQAYTQSYFPTWMEWVGFFGLIIGALLVILFFVENFRVLEGVSDAQTVEKPAGVPATAQG
ncbi:NrfD/PsrC family molybdoenzyme membrane anchor subunit [Candidatus Desulforudis audaxviator]|uniref:Polysulphide reductase, NrfD n=1 Tax=Desulforudis audaxviator (strain MP104C) TaxID=477974 RepID=B1I0U5_DESAP|nr:NrfD/PsrC family molybdoenzyme membrane anchor subunit [Candidatus Desulforudis audaxviator]ACA58724.1 Polysulphide reductase, NrfD [Candidatus Desulforudis audaxviator MP104C]AZK58732.1 Polysulfide reductase NrfD [Candidatus Desulforudis audaxviator]